MIQRIAKAIASSEILHQVRGNTAKEEKYQLKGEKDFFLLVSSPCCQQQSKKGTHTHIQGI